MEFLNADALAAGLSPLQPELKALAAGRLLLSRWRELMRSRTSFAVESTLSGKTYVNLIKESRGAGYEVRIAFLALPDPETSSARVFNRVISGGHNIPAEDIVRRFPLGLRNFFELYLPVADKAILFDSAVSPPTRVAQWDEGNITLFQPDIYEKLRSKF